MHFSRSFSIIHALFSLSLSSCTPHTNAMAGWKYLGEFSRASVPETIQQDVHAYTQTMPTVEKEWIDDDSHVNDWEDGTGQHAVVLDAFHNSEYWTIALIYNQDNRRIKILKCSTGGYME